MNRYTLEQRVFIIRVYWKTDSIQACQEQFVERFGDNRHPPSKSTIWALAKKLETHGTLLDRHAGGREQMTQETITNVDRLLASPSKSLRRLSQETGVSKSSCQRVAKKAKLHAYRYTVVHELKETDKVKRAWFHLSGYINDQNSRVWARENPHMIHEEPLHSAKIGVWCAISPIFFNTTVATNEYLEIFNML
ncbi:hypothetical protein L9F63_025520 [Diploptera punctata]|uniref:DUF4817 domain-containing protein n=1 Tax=Diploptera punctata TaxID=6984 RepID=A0AAD8E458_DIPPU|nr:hypothetical protein L9F63_025520 [Diploptera punctata]